MNCNLLKSLILIGLFFTVSAFSQTTSPTPPVEDDKDVVKISTSLVQVDAIVTDKAGNPVTNLTANDFEIWQDGKPQTITNVTFINRTVKSDISNQTANTKKTDKNIPVTPSVSSNSAEFGRILTFIVDDGNCKSTMGGMIAAKEGLEKFVNEQMLPNDAVAIYQTRGGSSLLQQYTSDKTRLLNIIKKIRWFIPYGRCDNPNGDAYEPARDDSTGKPDGSTFENQRDKDRRENIENTEKSQMVESVYGVLRYAINGLKEVSGRKILFLMSDGIPLIVGNAEKQRTSDSTRSALDGITNSANRASVVINSIDVRGLDVPMVTAQDNPGGIKENINATNAIIAERQSEDDGRQSGLFYIANETGGKFYRNMNFLDVPIQKALQSEKGYYLIGYQPEDETFKGKNFHKIEIKLKRSDLKTSSRSGFYGITDEAIRPKPRTGDSELYDVLSAPLPNADMNIRLSAYFANNLTKGNFIHANLYIDGKDISFVDGANGNKKAVFDIVAVTLNEKNEVIDDSNSTQTVQIPPDKVEEIQRNGLIYTVDVPVKKAGVYTFRTALREATIKRLGSSSQTIEVPNLKKDRVFLSGLIVGDADSISRAANTANTENGFSTVISKSVPAIRKFQRSSTLVYDYTIYNAKLDKADNQPKLLIQMNLYRDGKILFEGKQQSPNLSLQTDMTRINNFAQLQITSDVALGDYALQIVVKDTLTNQTSSQWIDFEIVE